LHGPACIIGQVGPRHKGAAGLAPAARDRYSGGDPIPTSPPPVEPPMRQYLRFACLLAAALALVAFASPVTAMAEEADAAPAVAAASVLRLGPLPPSPVGELDGRVHASADVVPEIDPRGWLPGAGDDVPLPGHDAEWRRVSTSGGAITLDEPGVWWLAARLVSGRWAEVTVDAGDDATVWVDGVAATDDVALPAGACFVFARVEADSAGAVVSLTASGDTDLAWDLEPRLDVSRFDRARGFSSLGSLAVAPRGALVAYHHSRRNPTGEGRRGQTVVIDGRGEPVAADLGGPGARPLAFAPDGERLLLRRHGDDGADLLLWTAPRGPVTTIVTDEPGLGLARFDPAGERLLLATTRGLDAADPDPAQRRWDALRERVSDWSPRPHLQVVDIATGARRVLTAPGDWTLDDAAWLPDGRGVVYARTLPQTGRPWFHTEIRVVDLATGEDRLAADFTGGWEVRPQALTPHPDGRRVAFIGPPDQVGGGRAEHNVYHKQVWLLDLQTGEFTRRTNGMRYAFEAGRGLPAWRDGGKRLLLPAGAGSRDVLVSLKADGDDWTAEEVPTADGTGGGWALDPRAEAVAYVVADPQTPGRLMLQALGGRTRELAAPDRDLASRLDLASAEDASFTGPGDQPIEAWWYRPVGARADDLPARAAAPLIVYYYGGSSPTTAGFNTTHQFWAANGYAVLVINPRGASGYGDAFADHHAGDWGPVAAGDILAGADALLAAHPELDPARVGCYGGSYGGFMTMYLVGHSDRFAAAVAMYGIADLATYWGQGAWGWTYGDMAVGGRMPWEHPEYFTERSPLFAAGDVQTPLLLLHGDADANVTPGESAEMFTALQVQGKPVEMVTFAGEDHGIAGTWESYRSHRTMMLEWFDRWLKDQPAAWEHRWAD
jgi:dipeptidyl aminopeptidase/acylaminoacyl peptidase